jgi:thioesterase domain-containing protein/acyl carrier protein
MVGHSIGEYVAACLAGVFSLEDVLSLVATRGRLMQELSAGSMLAVPLTEAEIQPFLGEHLSLATVNTPGLCVVSGEKQAVDDLQNQLASRDVACRPLHTSHAFHSEMMDPILPTFTECVKQVRRHSPQIPYLSNVSGTWITPDEAMDPAYWSRHLRQTVRFSDCVGKLLKESNRVFLEVGPGQTLSTLVKRHPNRFKEQIVLSSIRHPKEQKSDIGFILTTLGRLWLAGIQIDWSGFYKDERRHRIPLPTYPFERQRYWIEPLEQPRGFLGVRAGLVGKGRERFPQANIPISRQDDEIPQESEFPGDYTLARDSEKQRDVVAPSNEVEHTIVDIWQKLFGIERIGIHDNYFDLGGDSLLAPYFFSQIEKQFKKRIPLATLFDAPTAEQLAKIIMNDDWSWSPLVALQVGGVNPPFFCIHGADGDIFVYRNLARHLGSYQPFYGLQSPGLDGKQPFLTRIEDMASRYIQEIQTVQPEGPYLLGGYCMGGTIALEMAQQLQAQGQKVDLLVLLETYNWAKLQHPSILGKTHHYAQKIAFHWQNLLLAESKWTFLHEKIKVAKNRRKVWSGSLRAKVFNNFHQSNGYNELLHNLWETNDRAVLSYVPKVYPGKITLFSPLKHYARYDTPELCWENMASGGVEIHTLPVFPAGMLMEPFVKTLSAELKTCMAKAVNGELKN